MQKFFALLMSALLLGAALAPAHAETRIALVVGNSGYGTVSPLDNPSRDARLIAETIDLVAVLSGRGALRRLAELARVEGLGPDGDYRVTPASQSLTGDPS